MTKKLKQERRAGGIFLTGDLIRRAREARGMTSEDLADYVGICASQITHMENGRRSIFQDRPAAKIIRHILFGEAIKDQRRVRIPKKIGRPKKKG